MKHNITREENWSGKTFYVKITVLIIFLLNYIVARGTMREENDSLKCQIEAYKNELEMMKAEKVNGLSEKDSQLKILQQAMQGMQQVGGGYSEWGYII